MGKVEDLEKKIKELEELNSLYKRVINDLPVGIRIYDKNGFSHTLNNTQKGLLGLHDTSVGIGKFNVLTDPSSISRGVVSMYKKAYQGESTNHIYEYNSGDKTNKWDTQKEKRIFKESIIPLKNKEGKVDYVIALLQDLTSTIKAQQALKESEQRFNAIYNQDKCVKILIDPDSGNVVDANTSALDYYGYSIEEIRKKNIYEINQLSSKEIKHTIDNVLDQKADYFCFKHQLANGEIRDVEVYSSLIVLKDTSLLFSTIHDITQQKIAESNLIKSEKRYKDFVNHSPDIIYNFSINKGTIFLSKSVREILGFDISEFNTNPFLWIESIHSDDKERVLEAIENYSKGTDYSIEYRIKTKWGEWKWLHDFFMHKTKVGDDIVIEGHASDITKRKELEMQLEHANQRFDLAMDATLDGIWDWDLVNNKIYLSPNWKRMLGYENEAIESTPDLWKSYIHPDDYKNVSIRLDNHINGHNERFYMEFRMKHKNGHWVDILSRANVYFDETGRVCRMVGTHIDITQRKLNAQKIQESQIKFKSIFDIVDMGLILTDEDGRIIECNRASEDILGVSKEILLAHNIKGKFNNVIRPDNTPMPSSEFAATRALVEKRHVLNVELGIIFKDRTTWISTSASPLNLPDYGVVVAFVDITVLKQNQEELEALNETKDKFISIIAHDLRSPFHAILGFLEIAKYELHEGNYSNLEKYCTHIHSAAQNTFQLLNNLLNWANMQSSGFEFNPEAISLNKLVNITATLLAPSIKEKNIQLELNLVPDVKVWADTFMLETILRNMLSNAIKYTDERGLIKIETVTRPDKILISVIDSGIGIHKENMAKLFDMDSKFSTKGTNNERGTGLGLVLCKEFVEKHGGVIMVESEVGKGTTFSFELKRIL